MRMRWMVLVLLTVVSAFPARGEQAMEDGKQIVKQCDDRNPVNIGFCFGYIMGIADVIADREACFEAGTTLEDISLFVRRWLARRPHLHRYSANSLIIASLREGFPCPRRDT